MSKATVLIPAHNEAVVIGRCLETLLRNAAVDEFEVIVLSNGSTDQTAERARVSAQGLHAGSSVTVVDLAQSGKAAAINHGLDAGRGPKFLVLDADVLLDTETTRDLCRSLDEPGTLAASTTVGFDFDGVSWFSRSYHQFWKQVPSVANGLAGRGVYAFNPKGLERFVRLPLIIADDRFVDLVFGLSERTIVEGSSTVVPCNTLRTLIDRKSRVFLGNRTLRAEDVPGFDPRDRPAGGWHSTLRSNPSSLVHLPAYLGVNLLAKAKARMVARKMATVTWDQGRN